MRPALPLLLLAALATPAMADPLDDRAAAIFAAAFADACLSAFAEDGSLIEPPQRHEAQMASTYGEAEAVTLWQFRCNIGAYNVTDVFLLRTEMDGIVPLTLAQPVVQALHEDPEDFESPVQEVKITGWTARNFAVNPNFDVASATLTATGYWRGIGDAYDAGTWVLRDGGFQLVRYEVDASYDGQTDPQLEQDYR